MKRLLAVVLLLAVVFALPAFSEMVTNQVIPFSLTVFVPCAAGGAGEIVDLSGNLHDMFAITINGNNVTMKFHDQPQGVTGTGETTGLKYNAVGETQTVTHMSVNSFPFVTTFTNNFKIVGQGPGNNFMVHETYHVTVNANGTTTATVDNISVTCS